MAITRTKKEETLSKLSKLFTKADLLMFLGFRKLSVAKISEFRRKLRQSGASYVVTKKRLMRLTLKNEGIDMPQLEGEVAFIFSGNELLAAAKELHVFTKAHREEALILGGVYEKNIVDSATIVQFAQIPPREVLIARVLGVLSGQIRGLVGVLSGPQRGLVIALKQIADKK